MPKYRVYLGEGIKVDIDAHEHSDKNEKLEFYDSNGKVVASFSRPSLKGYVKIENLVSETN